uniref:RNA-dependent RNA polymerase n=1 Tax=Plasmopara viticola lesion associated narnavirus 24 TaxID=2719508 RepID=A0A6G9RTH3_9VIRU|nr:RNA-dependent RNA polymerase [Plasmopara viticola lesion associated narnavirus 24]
MSNHLDLITSRLTVPEGVQDQIEQYVYSLTRDKFVGRSSHVSAPISNHAVGECSKARGGYNGHINQCAMDPSFLGVDPPLSRGPRTSLTRALWRTVDQDTSDSLSQYSQSSFALPSVRMVESFVNSEDRVVHSATGIAEQGDKCRIITVPPASLFAAGDVCRQLTWSTIKQSDHRLFGGDEPAKARASKMGLKRGQVYVSADLTKATDGFAHDAVRAVLRGLRRAGLDPHVVNCMADTLGVGHRLHYVKYKLAELPRLKREWCVKRFEVVEEGKCVLVPMVRGILMGTPCSFTILSILNGWCAKPLGSSVIICGDDVAAACMPESVDNYDRRVTIVGSGLHKRKTFIGHRGLLFCELYVLPEFKEDRCFEPVPLKSLAKDGIGTMDTKHFDTAIWKRMDRACRVLWKSVRAKARRLGRWPQLPVELGGLGHPSSGKMGALPGSMRNRLATLIKECSPTEKIPRWSLSSQPQDWASYGNDNEVAWTCFESSIATVSQLDADFDYEEPYFVSYREARQFVSVLTNEYYTAHGGKFVNEENRKKFKPAKVQYPGVSSLQYSAKAPMSMVAREYCAKLDAEGEYLPYDAVRQIRKRTCKSGWDL